MRTMSLIAAVGFAAVAFMSTPPPANAECGGHQAMKTTAGTTDTYAQQYIPMSGPKFSIGTVQAKNDPAAKIDKAAPIEPIIGHITAQLPIKGDINGIVNISAKNEGNGGIGGLEVAANASEGVWPLTAGPKANTTIGHIDGETTL